jgi:hypothetical protein
MRVDTKEVVRRQLRALGNRHFELGIQHRGTGAMDLRTLSAESILDSVGFLKWKNQRGHFIRIRAKWPHPFVLIDDLSIRNVYALDRRGFSPSVVVESSPENFQAWLNLGRRVGKEVMTLVARHVASTLDADQGAANWRQAGALAGFTNCKAKYQRRDGLYPFVRLHMAQHQVVPRAKALIRDAKRVHAAEHAARERARAYYAGRGPRKVEDIAVFHERAKYESDLHRADFAWAIHALSGGWSEERVEETILRARDLRHKGSRREQEKYARRTVCKALRNGLGRTIDLSEETLARRGGLGR